MNINNVIQKFSRNVDIREDNSSVILFPSTFYAATVEMCHADYETTGILVGTKNEWFSKVYMVQSMIMLGKGTSLKVVPDPKKITARKIFLSQHPNLFSIDFHTHTTGTVRDYGQVFEESFSEHDVDVITRYFNFDNNYKHVLFTEKNILTFGLDRPVFQLISSGEALLQKHEEINSLFQSIYNEL